MDKTPADVDGPPQDMSQKPSAEHEDEAFKLSEEDMVKAEAEKVTNYDGHLPGIDGQSSQTPFKKLLESFHRIKNIGTWFPKGAYLTSIILLSVTLFGSISVLGLLQSTESVSTLDINIPISSTPLNYPPPPPPPEPETEFDVFLGPYKSTESVSTPDINIPISSTPSTNPPPPPPPEPKTVFSIHGDSKCTKTISDIKWGPIEVGGQVSKTIYVKNSGDQSITLSLYVENWDPVESSDYMNLSWDYDGSSVEPGSTIEVTLTLTVDSTTPEIDKFSFQILIIGTSS